MTLLLLLLQCSFHVCKARSTAWEFSLDLGSLSIHLGSVKFSKQFREFLDIRITESKVDLRKILLKCAIQVASV